MRRKPDRIQACDCDGWMSARANTAGQQERVSVLRRVPALCFAFTALQFFLPFCALRALARQSLLPVIRLHCHSQSSVGLSVFRFFGFGECAPASRASLSALNRDILPAAAARFLASSAFTTRSSSAALMSRTLPPPPVFCFMHASGFKWRDGDVRVPMRAGHLFSRLRQAGFRLTAFAPRASG